MNFDSLFKFRIAQRKQRLALQISCKDSKPDSGKGEDCGNIHQTRDSIRRKLRPRQPKKIDQAHENEPDGDFGQQFGTTLKVAREKRKKRHKKVKNQNENGDNAPGSVKPGTVKTDFLWQVAGPNDQELRETEISPEHDESKQQLAEVVQVAVLDDPFHRRGAGEQNENGDHQRHRRNQLSDDEKKTIDSRGPVWRERHDPIDCGEGHDEHIEDDARACQHLHPAAKRTVFSVDVLFLGPAIEYVHQQKPDRKVNYRTNEKTVACEIRFLEIRKRSFTRRRCVEPLLIEMFH